MSSHATAGQHTSQATAPPGTQAVDRAALLVATVVRADNPLAFGDIAEECGLPRSTTSRLLTALERTELLERNGDGSYVAGPLFWQYAARQEPLADLIALAQPAMIEIGEVTGETVHLGAPRGDRVEHLAQVDSRFLLGTRDWTQVDVPAHCSALGKVLYAFDVLPLPADEEPLVQPTDAALGTVADLRAELRTVRRTGLGQTRDELEPGFSALAAPVRDEQGAVIAALGMSGPTARLAPQAQEWGQLITHHADRVSALLARGSHQTRPARQEGVA